MRGIATATAAVCLASLSVGGVEVQVPPPSTASPEDIIYVVSGDSSSVEELTDEDFDEQVQGGKEVPWFLEFYAPWCGHCKSLTPEWERLPGLLGAKARVGKVDATVEERLAKDFEVEGFPTLKLLSQGQVYTYKGPRKAEAMATWAAGEFIVQSSESYPPDQSLAAAVKKALKKSGDKVLQVHSRSPSVMPSVLVLGVALGLSLHVLVALCAWSINSSPRAPVKLDETLDVKMVRDEAGVTGLVIDGVVLRVVSVDGGRENLSSAQVGDIILAVNKEAVTDGPDYQRLAHGVPEFTLTLGRSSKVSAEVAKSEEKKEQ